MTTEALTPPTPPRYVLGGKAPLLHRWRRKAKTTNTEVEAGKCAGWGGRASVQALAVQSAEHATCDLMVMSSSPTEGTEPLCLGGHHMINKHSCHRAMNSGNTSKSDLI